jgi:hypothetical protein
VASLIALLVAACVLAGCASVPGASPVEPLRRITEGYGPPGPPGPGENASPLELVLGFLKASASEDNRHGAARRFLTPDSQDWDDTASVTVLGNQITSSFTRSDDEADEATVWLHGTQLGTLGPDNSFTQDQGGFDRAYQVVRVGGQWRLRNPPPGVVIRFADFHAYYRSVALYFVDPTQHNLVADLRNLVADPARTMPSRVMDGLLGGPSAVLTGAAMSAIPRTARLRSNVAPGPDGSVSVDLTELGDLNDIQRKLIAEQIVLSMAEVNISQVTLLDDGAPLMAGHAELSPDSFAGLDDDGPDNDVPGLAIVDGRAHGMLTDSVGGAVAGPAGAGDLTVTAATLSADGQRLAVVDRSSGRRLLVGPAAGPLVPSGLHAASLSAPTWTPDDSEVWAVADDTTVSRVVFDQNGHPGVQPVDATAITRLGPITDLRLSRDGARVAAVVGGQLVVGAIIRSPGGAVRIGNVRVLRPAELTALTSVAWKADDQLAVAGRRSAVTVGTVSVDGLDLRPLPWTNLTPPLTGIAVAPGRPLLVTDQNGLWSFGMDEVGNWHQIASGASVVAGYPD